MCLWMFVLSAEDVFAHMFINWAELHDRLPIGWGSSSVVNFDLFS